MWTVLIGIATAFVIGALLISTYRLLRGPSLADRIVALDLMSTVAVGAMGLTALITGHVVYIDVAIVLGLVAFLATVAFGSLIEHEGAVMNPTDGIDVIDIISAILAVLGSFFMFTAALGVLRMPDIYTRLHCSTKSATLGVGLILLAVGLYSHDWTVWIRCIAGIVFFVLTVPVGGHILARAGYRVGVKQCEETLSDEWAAEGGPSTSPVAEQTKTYKRSDASPAAE